MKQTGHVLFQIAPQHYIGKQGIVVSRMNENYKRMPITYIAFVYDSQLCTSFRCKSLRMRLRDTLAHPKLLSQLGTVGSGVRYTIG